MKEILLWSVVLFIITSCSSQQSYGNAGKCIICNKPTLYSSIGYCQKHFTLEKEQILRGITSVNPKR
ncbi:hypothetical protein [Flavobacterium sp.]|uniref:hypothetical protein n=1 Tax=Flavobacterium sp. TaxID=239 RepID=UPI002BBA10EB|nr:hypothetical protein [Flavobacterium sp.]HSD08109.1 hypothetical protein [Flavobacterium sp.]